MHKKLIIPMVLPLLALTSTIKANDQESNTNGAIKEVVSEAEKINPSILVSPAVEGGAAVEGVTGPGVDEVDAQKVYYVSTKSIRVRNTPEDKAPTVGFLFLNDRVRMINSKEVINGKYVQVEIVKTDSKIQPAEKYYVAKEFLSEKIIDYKDFTGKLFAVVNVASETVRVYERQCADNSCPHKLLMEAEVVVGEDVNLKKEEKGKGRSILGSFRITGWTKYYEDGGGHYPAWYKDGYPSVPAPGDSGRGWFNKDVMPKDEEGKRHGSMRGAFGWYAMFLGPEAYGQWTHGTIGWGEDKDKYVARTKRPLVNLVSNPRSSGCTRVTNETIAYLRQLLPTGTPIIKIYAKEALLDSKKSNYTPMETISWKYALTKDKQLKADYEEVKTALKLTDADMDKFRALRAEYFSTKNKDKKNELSKTLNEKPFSSLLEVGEYQIDNIPDVVEFTPGEKMSKFGRKIGRKGNVYGMKTDEMQGVYYVDAGIIENYAHPTKLETGGFQDEMTPPWMDSLQQSNK